MINVLLVDDYPIMRQLLRDILARYPDVCIVGEAQTGEEAIALSTQLQPTVVIIDINLPTITGTEATTLIKLQSPCTTIIGLTAGAPGHTEAAIDFARLAGFRPAGVICEIMNDDGTMARLPQLVEVAKKLDLKLVSIEDLVAYRMQHDSLIHKKEDFEIQTRFGEFRLRAYLQITNKQVHIALTKGSWSAGEPILTRINSTHINNDILGTLTNNDADKKLDDMFKRINEEGKGAILFINHQTQASDLLNRLSELKELQEKGIHKAPQIKIDIKDFGIGAQILHDLDISKIRLLSNSAQTKRVGMIGYGLEITEYVGF